MRFARRPRWIVRLAVYGILAATLAYYGLGIARERGPYNGFDVADIRIPLDQLRHGGPGRDGIPAIDEPRMIPAAAARHLADDDRVLGILTEDGARAYPIRILNWHEIVNDRVGGRDLLVTWCPLCGTGAAFAPPADGRGFGVSGLLYQSDLVFYDRATESLWPQVTGRAISGPRAGEVLPPIPVEQTRWADWRDRFPTGLVLAEDTGHRRDYNRDPYRGYREQNWLMFDVTHRDPRYPLKTPVVGLEIDGAARVWPFPELSRSPLPVHDTLADREIVVHFDRRNGNAWIEAANGERLPGLSGFWFAWIAFHPDSSVYTAPE